MYFRYDDNNRPLTRFYCQTWVDTGVKVYNRADTISLRKPAQPAGIPFILSQYFKDDDQPECLLCYPGAVNNKYLLGHEVFEGKSLPNVVNDYDEITSPKEMIDRNPPGQSREPGLYIVG